MVFAEARKIAIQFFNALLVRLDAFTLESVV